VWSKTLGRVAALENGSVPKTVFYFLNQQCYVALVKYFCVISGNLVHVNAVRRQPLPSHRVTQSFVSSRVLGAEQSNAAWVRARRVINGGIPIDISNALELAWHLPSRSTVDRIYHP